MKQNRAPLYEALSRYLKKKITKFHVPGHQYGRGLPIEMFRLLGKGSKFDLSVLEEIDSLAHPQSVIKEAQELAAEVFGSEETLFLVNGSTIGVQSMILSTCSFNDKILVSRNIHQSIVAGLILSGAKPIYLQPEFDEKFNLPLNIKPEVVEKSLKEHPDAKAILIVNPTQFGITTNLKKIAEITHQAGKILLVDEAWGAHLKFHRDLPLSALESGADLVVQSTHKRLPALSQASMLHLQGPRIDREKIKNTVRFLQTTSPSYILLTSLDLVRKQMALIGKDLWEEVIDLAQKTRDLIKELRLRCLDKSYLNKIGFDLDLTNITLEVENGFKAWEIFNQNRIEPEFATLDHLIFLIGIGNNKDDFLSLVKALKKISPPKYFKEINPVSYSQTLGIKYPINIPKISLSPREASFKKTKRIKIENAIGRIAAETITPYPPGIPLLMPGEIITQEISDYLKEINKYSSIRMQILGDFKTIKVVK